jgi:hypothetical protein
MSALASLNIKNAAQPYQPNKGMSARIVEKTHSGRHPFGNK